MGIWTLLTGKLIELRWSIWINLQPCNWFSKIGCFGLHFFILQCWRQFTKYLVWKQSFSNLGTQQLAFSLSNLSTTLNTMACYARKTREGFTKQLTKTIVGMQRPHIYCLGSNGTQTIICTRINPIKYLGKSIKLHKCPTTTYITCYLLYFRHCGIKRWIHL